MEITFNSVLLWFLATLNAAIPVIIGVVIAGRINKLIDKEDNEDENPEKEENN